MIMVERVQGGGGCGRPATLSSVPLASTRTARASSATSRTSPFASDLLSGSVWNLVSSEFYSLSIMQGYETGDGYFRFGRSRGMVCTFHP